MDTFTRAYITCALWSSTIETEDRESEYYDQSFLDAGFDSTNLSPETRAQILEDCAAFQAEHADLLARAGDDAQNGHDFWLTRNGHGAGFWDRGYGAIGRKLSDACKPYGDFYLHLGTDGLIHS